MPKGFILVKKMFRPKCYFSISQSKRPTHYTNKFCLFKVVFAMKHTPFNGKIEGAMSPHKKKKVFCMISSQIN